MTFISDALSNPGIVMMLVIGGAATLLLIYLRIFEHKK